jgi:N-formylmaleamate deformylase
VPIFHSIVRIASFVDSPGLIRKNPRLLELRPGGDYDAFDERLYRDGEHVLDKKGASVFYGTCLHASLTALGADTLIVAGMSTSGCVRATVVDGVQCGFRVVVPRECVADRIALVNEVSLADMQSRYADVMGVAEVAAVLGQRASNQG